MKRLLVFLISLLIMSNMNAQTNYAGSEADPDAAVVMMGMFTTIKLIDYVYHWDGYRYRKYYVRPYISRRVYYWKGPRHFCPDGFYPCNYQPMGHYPRNLRIIRTRPLPPPRRPLPPSYRHR